MGFIAEMTEIYLYIYMFVTLHFFSIGPKKVYQFFSGVLVSCPGTANVVMEGLTMASFFTDSNVELHRFHRTNSERDFNRLIQRIRPRLKSYAARLSAVRPLGVVGMEDYVQIGIITIWRKVQLYRFICPTCEQRLERYEDYKSHCENEHGKILDPVTTLEKWLDCTVRQYMRNHLRDMGRPEAKPELTMFNSDTLGSYTESIAMNRPDKMLFSRLAIERVEALLEVEQNPKVRMLITGCLNDVSKPRIWEMMVACDLAKTPKSACVCVNRLMKRREMWRDYRAALGL